MTVLTIIKDQLISVNEKTNFYINSIPLELWNTSPEVLNTNLNWQIGHIILANYLHGVASLSGANTLVREKINMQNFVKYYGPNSTPNLYRDEKPTNEELIDYFAFISEMIQSELKTLTVDDLQTPTAVPNPSTKTKYDALTTLFKHQSWHNGQIAMLKRILEQ